MSLDNSVFIIGSPRSCTSFLGACLSSLPEMDYHNEPLISKGATAFAYRKQPSEAMIAAYYKLAWGALHRNKTTRFAEKTPRNSMIGPFLAQHFPSSQFIHIVRDVRDVAVSHLRKPWLLRETDQRLFFDPERYLYGTQPRFWVEEDRKEEFRNTSDLHRIAWEWRRYNQAALELEKTLPSNRYLRITMEHMAVAPEDTAAALLSFLNISDANSTAAFQSAIANTHTNSIGQWRGQFSQAELECITREVKNLPEYFGYDLSGEASR